MDRFHRRPLRRSRAAFWHLDADRLVAAVISRSDADEEPVLEGCAASWATTSAGASFAPGIVEMAAALGARRFLHVAALGARYCRVESIQEPEGRARGGAAVGPGASSSSPETVAIIREAEGLRVHAPRGVVREAAALFRDAHLHLLALDCEPCALATLDEVLGLASGLAGGHAGTEPGREARQQHPLRGDVHGHAAGSARRQALAAVSVRQEAEKAAEALGEQLAVPVGLAVAWFGGGRHAS